MKKNKKWGGGSFKYLIPGIIAVILLSGVLLSNKFITKQAVGSIYNIDEAESNIESIKQGDTINYEINGYSDWQVLYIDKENGTIDVAPKTNIEDLTLESDNDRSYYEEKLIETSSKYVDDKYAINSRPIASSDLDYLLKDNQEYWVNNISEESLKTSTSSWKYKTNNYKIYVIPYIIINSGIADNYNSGDTYQITINDISEWIVVETNGENITLIPANLPEIVIENNQTDINEIGNNIIESYNTENVISYGNYYGTYDMTNLVNLIPNFLDKQKEDIWFYDTDNYSYTWMGEHIGYKSCDPYYYISISKSIEHGGCGNQIYKEKYTRTSGYRPVVTLKLKSQLQDEEKKDTSDKLYVGDNVKYEAKGYKNWKVLSIDNGLGTVDIISGGIVKNITLYGEEDYNNYELILDNECINYKTEKAIDSHVIKYDEDYSNIYKVDKRTKNYNATFFADKKKIDSITGYGYNDDPIIYNNESISIMKEIINESFEVKREFVTLYTKISGGLQSIAHYGEKNNGYNYTAGLRPIITLKLDSVEKLPEEEAKKIEESTEKQEKIFIKEQESKNKNYKGPSKVDDSTSSTGNNNEVKSNDNDSTKKDNITENNTSKVEKIVYKDKPSTRYQLIIQYIIIVLQLGVIIYLLLKKKK